MVGALPLRPHSPQALELLVPVVALRLGGLPALEQRPLPLRVDAAEQLEQQEGSRDGPARAVLVHLLSRRHAQNKMQEIVNTLFINHKRFVFSK